MSELKLKLKYWRLRRAFNIKELAKIANVSTSTIVKIEKTGYVPRGDVVRRLAASLNVPLDDMWEETAPNLAATKMVAA